MERVSKIVLAILIMLFVEGLLYFQAEADKPTKNQVIRLYQNDLWGNKIEEGAHGKLEFNTTGPDFEFIFKGELLEPNLSYALIRSREPGTSLPYRFEHIVQGISDDDGDLYISGSYDFNIDLISAKFLLVPEYLLDLPANGRPGPSGKYISGQGLIGYNDTDTDLQCGCQSSGASGFDQLGIQKGEKAIDFTLRNLENEDFNLYQFLLTENKPLVLIFGAYT